MFTSVPFLRVYVVAGNSAAAGPVDDPELAARLKITEEWLRVEIRQKDLPGISTTIVHDQEAVGYFGGGFMGSRRRAAIGPSSRSQICSITKLFTAMAIMQLQEKGKVGIETLAVQIEEISAELEVVANTPDACRHLFAVSGVGSLAATAMIAAIGNGTQFSRGRQFSTAPRRVALFPQQSALSCPRTAT